MAADLSFDHLGLVVDDLETMAAFFTGLGFSREDLGEASGAWVDRIVGLEDTVEKLVRIYAPDGTGHIELTKFTLPTSEGVPSQLPSNAYGLRHVAYRVADVNATVAAARTWLRPRRRGRGLPRSLALGLRPRA
jgi:catechol 2,3-dioxygenase-like lactoylglutathione lyase family enzyme